VVNLARAAKLLGALGASKGGYARAAKLSTKELSKQGRDAVNVRWNEAGTYKSSNNSKRARIESTKSVKRARTG
jgi:hypothetical protein